MKGTPKARALGRVLRNAREETGLTLRAFAAKIDRDPGVLSRWENGERIPQLDQVAQILTMLGVTGERYDEIIALTKGTDEPHWLAVRLPEQRQQLNALVDFEQSATKLTQVSPTMVPGLLQVTPYIKAIMTGGSVPAGEIAARVAIRIGRREVLKTKPYLALVGEAALRQLIGSAEIMVEQLRHLAKMAAEPNVDLRVIPFDSGWNPALEGPYFMVESGAAPPVVQLENRRSVLFLHEERDVDTYRDATEMVLRSAASAIESAALIAEYTDRWEEATP
jgi:transcriptional regulator with XRE-family HTH domain